MEDEFINKYISVTPDTWAKLKKYAGKPENRRAAGHQAGMILKEFLDSQDRCDFCTKYFSDKKDINLNKKGDRLCQVCYKNEIGQNHEKPN